MEIIAPVTVIYNCYSRPANWGTFSVHKNPKVGTNIFKESENMAR